MYFVIRFIDLFKSEYMFENILGVIISIIFIMISLFISIVIPIFLYRFLPGVFLIGYTMGILFGLIKWNMWYFDFDRRWRRG
jgi:hypothetical protein